MLTVMDLVVRLRTYTCPGLVGVPMGWKCSSAAPELKTQLWTGIILSGHYDMKRFSPEAFKESGSIRLDCPDRLTPFHTITRVIHCLRSKLICNKFSPTKGNGSSFGGHGTSSNRGAPWEYHCLYGLEIT